MARARVILAVGALMLIGAAAGLVVVPEHHPLSAASVVNCNPRDPFGPPCPAVVTAPAEPTSTSPLSRTLYDVLLVASWALLIVGALVVAVGLIRYWRTFGRSAAES